MVRHCSILFECFILSLNSIEFHLIRFWLSIGHETGMSLLVDFSPLGAILSLLIVPENRVLVSGGPSSPVMHVSAWWNCSRFPWQDIRVRGPHDEIWWREQVAIHCVVLISHVSCFFFWNESRVLLVDVAEGFRCLKAWQWRVHQMN